MPDIRQRIHAKLTRLYGENRVQNEQLVDRLFAIIHAANIDPNATYQVSERDAILITYGDMVSTEGEEPLVTLRQFLNDTLYGVINSVHILPFYPYSSDDGFSVIDYYAVDPILGTWEDVWGLSEDFRLMFDAVVNHISVESDWFKAFLSGTKPYDEYFITVPPDTDLSQVVRPRALPLLTAFETEQGTRHVWTTFSADQVDLNYANPHVLLDVLRVLLFYLEKGAKLIRLDAIAFIWKEIGTSCIHLEETHLIIQLMRDILDVVAPSVVLITETNVPHEENISYFGDGTNEAQMVYNFALPPLVYHTMLTGDASALSRWASTLRRAGDRTTFFNFTASHDGIGLRPVTGILAAEEIEHLVQTTLAHGGRVSYKYNSDGTQSPYEMNITYFDAITSPDVTAEDPDTAVRRFLVSQAIALSLLGVPGIYFHSLFGSRNDQEGVVHTGQNRSINREKLNVYDLLDNLADEQSIPAQVYSQYRRLLEVRTREPAFHPLGSQQVVDIVPSVFVVERVSPDHSERILAIHNVTDAPISIVIPGAGIWFDLLSDTLIHSEDTRGHIQLSPYQVAWLKPAD